MPLYLVKSKNGEEERFIKAKSQAAAISHVTKDKYEAENISSADAIADILERGVKIEKAAVEAAAEEPASDAQQPAGDAEQPEGNTAEEENG